MMQFCLELWVKVKGCVTQTRLALAGNCMQRELGMVSAELWVSVVGIDGLWSMVVPKYSSHHG